MRVSTRPSAVQYRAKCAAIVENGWEGFAIDGEAVPAREEVFA